MAAWFNSKPEDQLFLSAITLGEIECGIARQQHRILSFANDLRAWIDQTLLQFADRLLPFGPEEARIWGQLSARTGHNGADLHIAATALAKSAIVVTRSFSDFEPAGVGTEDPF